LYFIFFFADDNYIIHVHENFYIPEIAVHYIYIYIFKNVIHMGQSFEQKLNKK